VPLLPEYLEYMNEDEVVFKNYEGKQYSYKQPKILPKDGTIVPIEIAARKVANG
jgi:hypothetical protein